MPFHVSAFGDEISDDLDEQLATLRKLKVEGFDLRSVGGVNVVDLTAWQLDEVKEKCLEAGLWVQAIGSPVNKVPMERRRRGEELRKLKKSIEAARRVGTCRIRIFSPIAPKDAWPKVKQWMGEQVDLAKSEGMLLMHENDGNFYGAYPDGARNILEEFGGANLKAIYDFANPVFLGLRPMRDWFPWMFPYLDTLHIKDAVEAERRVVLAGEGDGDLEETLRFLISENWHGTLTLEPHLRDSHDYGGFTGPESFKVAVEALRKVVTAAGGSC